MDSRLISNSLAFHGQPLQKIWEGERGCNEFIKLGITNPDFTVYATRQKTLTFQDRAKRLKLHQFIARKAPVLFNENLIESKNLPKRKDITTIITGALAILPPYESFINKNYDKTQHLRHALSTIQPGHIVYGQIISRTSKYAMVRIFCTGEPIIHYLVDVPMKAYLLGQNMIDFVDKRNNPKSISTNDYVCCEVLDISVDADRMNLGMKGTLTIDAQAPLGIITADQLPEYYKRSIDNVDNTFGEILQESKAFLNPNYDELLFQELGLGNEESFSNMSSLTGRYPQQEYASELRQIQASKWAFRSVADGIEHFKVGRHSEAFQCLNKALNIDPRNVEGLVARGALYANSGSFKKAVDDFETALKLNPYHANARKYMGETLVALARSYEEDNRIEEARKAYTDCLNIIPHHDEAKSSLEFLNSKISGQQTKQLIDTNDFILPGIKLKKDSPGVQIKKESKRDKKKKKQKEKNKRRDNSSSSNSTSDSGDSSSTDSSDTSSSDSSDSSTTKKKKKKKSNDKQNLNIIGRQKSLSPLSKRLALMDEQDPTTGTTRYQFNKPFHLLSSGGGINMPGGVNMPGDVYMTGGVNMLGPAPTLVETDYDAKVRSFLEMTRDEDDYESSVRKLLENASKHKNERKGSDEAMKSSKKKEKKKLKKMKKESKKEKKKKSKSDSLENMDLKEALKIFKSLPILGGGNSESKLTAELEKYEKSIDDLKKQQMPSTSNLRLTPPHYLDYQQQHILPPQIPPPSKLHFKIEDNRKNRGGSPNPVGPHQRNRPRTPAPIEQKPEIKPFQIRAPVVLDKFGCFRLATPQDDPNYQPPPPTAKQRRSRSGSQRRRSRSRSRSPRQFRGFRGGRSSRSRSPMYDNNRNRFRSAGSRSPRRRYSRSPARGFNNRGGGNRRSRSRSRSPRRGRSRSPIMGNRRFSPQRSPVGFQRRSRSVDFRRSRSFDRRRSGSPIRRSRSISRSPPRRGRGRGGYRGTRFRGSRRGGGYRGRGSFRGGCGPRSPFYRFGSRSRSLSRSRSRSRSLADVDESVDRKRNDRDKKSTNNDGKWTHDKFDKNENTDKNSRNESSKGDPSVEEIDKIINEAQKTRKEEIIQRDKDLLKKPTPTNLPF